ncbi:MAG TPA: AI-2E family transporter [Bacteroidia bacterium]|jgi:predicted PurR-regulated permease PerM|nr:AI-2E family transporter [Bacteroidia bacterium]
MIAESSSALRKLLLVVLVVAILIFAKAFLVPLCIGALLATLLLPFCKRMERAGMNKGMAAVLSLFLLVIFISGIGTLVGWQVMELTKDFALLKQKVTETIVEVQSYFLRNFGVSFSPGSLVVDGQNSSVAGALRGFAGSLISLITYFVLMLVYVVFLLYNREHLKQFLLRLSPPEKKDEMEKVLYNIAEISQQYLVGLSKMIFLLWVMYGIGFSIIGVKHALFFAILCGLLEIVPFIGNITGTTLTILFSAVQGASVPMMLSIAATYGAIQFIQGWVLEPLILGPQVKINPLFTIVALVIGDLVWGIPGVFLAIPVIAMFKIVCDHVETLKPVGFLIGEIEGKKKEPAFIRRMRGWFRKKKE